MSDEDVIKETLKLAKKGRGRVSPNPMVGAIVVKGNRIVAKGYHRYFGGLHAEVEALNSISGRVANGATLYVNLEPCSHHGKQPPCTDRILASEIRKVVIGTQDPNPTVNGKGLRSLRRGGVEVLSGLLEAECKAANEIYFKYVQTGLPFITLKIAQTLDGRIAGSNGQSKWITSKESRKFVHKLRNEHDAVLVGIGTVLADNPKLTVRMTRGRNPKRIVLDGSLRIPLKSNLLSDEFAENTVIFTKSGSPQNKIDKIRSQGAQVLKVRSNAEGRLSLKPVLRRIAKEGIASVLVEGGSLIYSELLKARLVDRVLVFVAPKILGDGLNAVQNLGINSLDRSILFDEFQIRRIGTDVLFSGRVS